MCDSVNKGTIQVLSSGRIHHVEIIGISPHSDTAISYCLDHPDIKVGCHVTLYDEFNIGFKFFIGADKPEQEKKAQLDYLKDRGLHVWRITSHMFKTNSDRDIKNCTWESFYIDHKFKRQYYDFTVENFPDKEIVIHCADESMKHITHLWESYIADVNYFK